MTPHAIIRREFIGPGDIMEMIGVSRSTAYRRIAEMKARGLGEINHRYPIAEVHTILHKMAHEE